jgi:phage shock protein A/DNA-binding XRE family transcriptional regulator
MGYRLRMSGEIYDWLTDLAGSDPPSALLVGQALTALLDDGAALGPPVVIPLKDHPRPEELPDALDREYQDRLESMRIVRRRVADAATLRNDIEREIAELESLREQLADQRQQAVDAGRTGEAEPAAGERATADDQLARLRPLLPDVIKSQDQLLQTSVRRQTEIDAFRTRKEVLKATHTAARAEQMVEQASAAPDADRGPGPEPPAGTAGRLREVTEEIERELGEPVSAEGLMELRPDAPGEGDIRILFAIEPPGTALLISVLEGGDAVEDHYREAVLLSAGVLRRVREGQDPDATAHGFDDAESFLDGFFPGTAAEVAAGAAALAARNRGRTLAEQRTRLGLTQAQVARQMGVRPERVSAIERAEPGATEVRTLASYVEALGGRLDIVADFGAERILLR